MKLLYIREQEWNDGRTVAPTTTEPSCTCSCPRMAICTGRFSIWRILVITLFCLSFYLYLYTNAFHQMRTSSVFRVVEGDFKAVWDNKVGSISYYLKLMQENPESIHFEIKPSLKDNKTQHHGATRKVATPSKKLTTPTVPQALNFPAWVEELKELILQNRVPPVLTLFTSWNETDDDKNFVHNITMRNWFSLRPFVIPVLFTNNSEVVEEASGSGWNILPISVAAAGDVPVLKYMYRDVADRFNSTFYAYANSDILFTDKLIHTLITIINSTVDIDQPVMVIGKRTNVANVTEDESSTWKSITAVAKKRGKLFTGYAEDYFITTGSYPWKDLPEVVIGRRAYDNYVVMNARKSKHVVIDVTNTVLAVHQTTKAGNFEGHGRKNGEYNHKLLIKLYKRIKYSAGVIDCAELKTQFTKGNIEIVKKAAVLRTCRI